MLRQDKDILLLCSVIFILLAGFRVLTLLNADAAASEDPSMSFRKDYPATSFKTIRPTDMDGLSEVVTGDNVVYYHRKTGNIIFGEVYSRAGSNLTEEARKNNIFKEGR